MVRASKLGRIVFQQHDRLLLLGRQNVQRTAMNILPHIDMHLKYEQGAKCTNLRLRFADIHELQSETNNRLMLQIIEICLSFSLFVGLHIALCYIQ